MINCIFKCFIITGLLMTLGCSKNTNLYSSSSVASKLTQSNLTQKKLFETDEVLELEIRSDFPYHSYKGVQKSPSDYPDLFPAYEGQIILKNSSKTIPIKLKARGHSKLELCDFAPVMLEFDKKNDNGIFTDQGKKIKLATHCDEGTSTPQGTNPIVDGQKAEEYVLKEYLAYKITEIMMPESSLKTRLAKIKYTDNRGKLIAYRSAFFLENSGGFYKRNSNYRLLGDKELVEILGEENFFSLPSNVAFNEIQQKNENIIKHIDLNNYIRFRYVDRMLIPSDRSVDLMSGNTMTILDRNTDKILRLHYDFDRSLAVGKFEIYNYFLNEDPNKTLLENFKIQLNNLCNVDSSPGTKNLDMYISTFYLTLPEKQQACREVNEQIKVDQNSKKVKFLIDNFPYLSSEQKKVLSERTEVFFQALSEM